MSVLQPWVEKLTFMQQSVLISGVRGPDGVKKHHPIKPIMRWYRRCVLYSAFEQEIILDPYHPGGGSFTGPLDPNRSIDNLYKDYFEVVDELPYHFISHFMAAAQIIGYKHSDKDVRNWWYNFYNKICQKLHVSPEEERLMDIRLGDNKEAWESREVLEREDTTYKENKCPTCGKEAVLTARDFNRTSHCEDGHTWHSCCVHKKLVLGESKINTVTECTCNT